MKLGVASIVLLFKLTEAQLQAGRSAVAEGNYRRGYDVPRFERLRGQYVFRLVEVYCETEASVLVSRLERRRSSVRDTQSIRRATRCTQTWRRFLPGELSTHWGSAKH